MILIEVIGSYYQFLITNFKKSRLNSNEWYDSRDNINNTKPIMLKNSL